MNLIDFLEAEITKLIKSIGYEDEVRLLVSGRPDLGDYQYNGAFLLAKKYHKNPEIIAEEIVNELKKTNYFANCEKVSSFINLTISNDLLIKYVNDLNNNLNINFPKYQEELIFLDYGGANVAKELHVGHLRSANIGEALKRLLVSVGYKTISDVHLGDWGRPMGLIIKEIQEMYPNLPYFDNNFKGDYPQFNVITNISDLNNIYPKASLKASQDKEYLEAARQIATALQSGHKGYYALWKGFYNISVTDIKRIYNKLNATFDLWEGESDANKYIPEMMEYLKSNNLTEISEGAMIINVKEKNDNREIPPVILIKSDGGILYDTTELATLYYRVKRFNPNKMIYLTDIRQELHFVGAFRAAYKTNIVPKETKLEHLGFGTINGPDGKPFKTRDGGVLSLQGLIDLVTLETRKLIKNNIKEEDKDKLAEDLAIAAIKYADLLPNRTSDYIFDPVKFSDLNGKTGLYLLYSTVRMKSLLKKCDEASIKPSTYKILSTKEERDIIINLLKIKSIIEKSVSTRTINEIAEYLYKLTNSFNAFYGKHEILTNKDNSKQTSWITLTNIVLETNLKLLNILGINVPNKI
ncbi:MAG: arginine--tRNA ligase [Bacilli bacterium]|nr:arginine--tRNA ligase [Bacilli bacterium]MDD3895983.1 arginine--tRNA ligase [Bacilli bacterium]MDD4407671.1 arginine--tRNA ligase [Bacilli bacterium]